MKILISLLLAGMLAAPGVDAAPLGAGDMLRITVYGSPDLTLETRLADSGKINYPLLGDVELGGMEPAAAERVIARLLSSRGYVKQPQVNVLVVTMQSQQISVLGNVLRPGRYPMEGRRSLLDVLALAGGINADGGDIATVVSTRNGKSVKQQINIPEMMRSADLTQNAELSGSDVVYVERAPKFYIYGEVQRPGVYRLEPNMTVVQALSTGGGLSVRGTERGVRIKRRDGAGTFRELTVKQDDLLMPNDVVYIKESLF
ncbi:polysaccharide export protein EpsE [Massilia sp. DWR3-1-1]|uniref:polysaccharide export protein EpsE n=1 Tax=Massilia sp. DWR3-1-1 TaxID=2804559 RepID=UPI003CF3144B